MTSNSTLSFWWNERFWFPANRSYGWKDLVNEPGSDIYLPEINHLHWSVLVGVMLLGVRYVLETLIVVPIALWLGVKDKKKPVVTPNTKLEAAFNKTKHASHELIKSLSKQTDLSERKIQIWFKNRKKMNQPTPIQKFRECSWHLMFYTIFFIYGIVVLWEKPYFWKTILCWEGWPKQHVATNVYYYYLLELGFYWSLVFTLFSDHKRKDFKEMIIHHFATIVLLYFSWLLNFVRVGTLVLAVHDAADTWLALAKMSIYANIKMATDIFFGIFLLVWVLSRLIVYPFVVLHCSTFELIVSFDGMFGGALLCNIMLYTLQVLHFIWSYHIGRILYLRVFHAQVEDVRSDSEEDSSEEPDNEEDTVDLDQLSNGTVFRANGKVAESGVKSEDDIHLHFQEINGNVMCNGRPDSDKTVKGNSQTGDAAMNATGQPPNGRPISPSKIPRVKKS